MIRFASAQQAGPCGHISTGKQKIYYCEQGVGSPVILIHPGFLDMRIWDKQVDSLAQHHRVIRIDLPGHGQSVGVDTSLRIAEVIRQVMQSRKITAASLVGISLGASCVVDFAIAHPEMVSRIVLCSPGLVGWEDVMKQDSISKRVVVRPDTYFNTRNQEMVTENYVHYWLDGPYRETANTDAATRGYLYQTALDKLKRANASRVMFDKRKQAKRARLIKKPVLILYGSLDIPFTAKVSSYLVKQIKGAEIHAVNGAHFFMLEEPAVFCQYLTRWLK